MSLCSRERAGSRLCCRYIDEAGLLTGHLGRFSNLWYSSVTVLPVVYLFDVLLLAPFASASHSLEESSSTFDIVIMLSLRSIVVSSLGAVAVTATNVFGSVGMRDLVERQDQSFQPISNTGFGNTCAGKASSTKTGYSFLT